jgi:peptidoglycan lytic transglycosylase G
MALSRGSKGFLAVLVILVLGVAGALTFLRAAPAPATSGEVTITIPEGYGAGQVADLLEQQGIIGSALAFRVGTRFDGRASQIQPGTYRLTPGMETGEILAILSQPQPERPFFEVTIPEGLTVQQTLDRLASADGSPLTVEALTAALPATTLPAWVPPPESLPTEVPYPGLTRYEGLLFPDTYQFFVDEDPLAILNQLIARTDEIMSTVPPSQQLDPYQVLTAASLIEREARLPEEQPTISSVIHNRLADGMRLEIDASVLYATASVGDDRVTSAQVDQPSPWNTYLIDGLPPTPIAGAGQGALTAAAAPAITDFRYYVVSDPSTGAHAFATTLDEHNANVARYRALQDG